VSQALFGGWDVGGIVNARSGVPINVLVTRPDVVRVWIRSSRTDFFSRRSSPPVRFHF
jgi:hypothetical protein